MQTFRDPESLEDIPLVPGMNKLDNMLRWGFIKKVYGIISAQMVLTVAVASVIIFNEPVGHFVTTSAPFQISVFAFSFLGKAVASRQKSSRTLFTAAFKYFIFARSRPDCLQVSFPCISTRGSTHSTSYYWGFG